MSSKADMDLLAIVGHTAGGKTALASAVAYTLRGEVISADSRQVYRGMDLGTGKDYEDYTIDGVVIPSHLIDIREAGERYTLYDFQEDFKTACRTIASRGLLPVLCGGTGLYVESILKGYHLPTVPVDTKFRLWCEGRLDADLEKELCSFGPLHNKTDLTDRDRLIRALEIARYRPDTHQAPSEKSLKYQVFGIRYEVEERRKRITERLKQRLESGMIEEVQELLKKVPAEELIYYGLEYKYLTLFCLGQITYDEMFVLLNTAIHQFAKRQMTWFRGMENRGIPITWIPGEWTFEKKRQTIIDHWLAQPVS